MNDFSSFKPLLTVEGRNIDDLDYNDLEYLIKAIDSNKTKSRHIEYDSPIIVAHRDQLQFLQDHLERQAKVNGNRLELVKQIIKSIQA